MKKNFKLHTNHNAFIRLSAAKKAESRLFLFFYYIGNAVLATLMAFGRGLYAACYHTGSAVVTYAVKTGNGYVREVNRTLAHGKMRFEKILSREFSYGLLVFLFFCLAGWGSFLALRLAAHALELKDGVAQGTQDGLAHLTKAQQDLVARDLAGANEEFSQALQKFSGADRQINEGNALLAEIINVLPQKQQAQNVLDAARLVAQAGTDLVSFYHSAQGLKFSAEGIEAGPDPKQTFNILNGSLKSAADKISTAQQTLSHVDILAIPAIKRMQFAELQGKLAVAAKAIQNFQAIFGLVQSLALPKQNVLILFENNNELRSGGGFMGTFANFIVENGKIKNLNVSSIYDLDGQLRDKISPPGPLLNVNTRWYLRDSNWFADFGESARKISSFYEKEGGETPDVIITLTPTLVTNLLKVTGPVQVPAFNATLDADNFVEKTQAISTMSYNTPLNKPKQLLADFFPIFIQKLSTLSREQYGAILNALEGSLSDKQLVLFSRDPATENLLDSFNWSGKIFKSDRDFLEINSSNLGGTKTDLFVKKNIHVDSAIHADGSITDTLTIILENTLPDLREMENTSFIRILVPEGSTLISNRGFDFKDLPQTADSGLKIDPDVAAWEGSAVKDVVSGTLIGKEAGKTFYGNWVTLKGGQSRTLELTYQLPYRLAATDRQSLVVQKQIGSVLQNILYTVHFPSKELKWESFALQKNETGLLEAGGPLDHDYFFGMVFDDRRLQP